MRKHAHTHGIAHYLELMAKPEYGYLLKIFMRSQIRVNIGVGGITRGVNASFFKAIGNLKCLIGRPTNVG